MSSARAQIAKLVGAGAKDQGAVGKLFQRELVASAATIYGCKWANVPDEKGAERQSYHGEPRLCDLIVPIGDRRTLYIEAKSCQSMSLYLRCLTDRQREGLDYLAQRGHEVWVTVNYRTAGNGRGDRLVNEAFGVPWTVLAGWMADGMKSLERTVCAWHTEQGTVRFLSRIAVQGPVQWGWDLRALEGPA